MAKKVYVRKKRVDESMNEDYGGGYDKDILNEVNRLRQTLRYTNEQLETQTALLKKLLQVFTVYAKKELAAEAEEQKKREEAEKEKRTRSLGDF